MRREAETFCREFSRENSLVLPAVLESTGQERCGLQRVREFRPGAHTAAMHTDVCKQYCGRPSLRVRLQIFRRLPFLASASRKLRLCRAQVRRAVRLINKAPATPVLLPPKLAQKSNPLRLLRKQVWADLIRSSQIPPPRQPVRRVIKTLAIIGADAAERGSGASQILKDSARYSENCLQRAGRTCGTASSPWPDPDSSPLQTRRCPPHALFSQVSADQKQNKLRENIQKCCVGQLCNSHPVRPITAANQRIWPTLQLGTRIGFTFSWKLSRPQARRDPLSGTQPQHCTSRRCELPGKYCRVLNKRLRRPRPKARWIAGLSRRHTLRCCTQMRREAETFCREFSRENSLVLPAVLESTGQERCGLQRVREFRPGAHTAAMHTDACKQYCGRPSLRVRLQIFRRLPFLASASRKLRLCRAQVRRAVRLINKAPATPVLLPPKLAQKSNPLRLLRKQVWADLIRSSQIPPPRQPVRRVIKTLAILGADAAERGSGASQILKDSARYSENCLTGWANMRNCVVALAGPNGSPLQARRCPPRPVSQVSADQKQNKLRENIQKCCVGQLCNSHPVRPITAANQRIWPTLQLGTRIGFTFSWKLSRPQARGAA
ncbi:Hypothetical_protein [Hexamita inflata]|uniref:Hypothetical_protein n=1 Tax=Hexamita inflata TaxID=28002 RepID=A0AA86PD04_9EUKA|nr:Hypothetical protein HINF_LOCUS24276 [Hexamita inflata]